MNFSYNLRQKDISVVDIALHRALSVIVGVVWAAFVSRFWWPAEARRELGKALSELSPQCRDPTKLTLRYRFCLNIGWLYTRLVASNSFAPEYHASDGNNEHEDGDDANSDGAILSHVPSQSTRLNNSVKEFMAMFA
jgi:hypothetical protein